MSVSELKEYTFKGKYARWIPEKKRRETWNETIDRFTGMFSEYYTEVPEINKYVERIKKSLKQKKVLGSQRGLQFGGYPILEKNARLFNCIFSYADRPRFYQEFMYLLLCGCGCGFSVQKHHIAKLPSVVKPSAEEKLYVIEDSIEGWSDAVGELVNSFFEGGDNRTVVFDYSKIRPKGAKLRSSGGKAPGPEPLKKALENVRRIFLSAGTRLKPIEVYDQLMFLSDAVISGGVRRSATICIFSKDDLEMRNAKTGNWFYENPQRGRSNNSVILLRNETTFEEFADIIKSVREFGEPGFVWADDLESGFNPCVEINLYAYDEFGNSGWQGCNLSTINCGKVKSKKDFYKACIDAAIIGTLQAGFTKFPYLGEVSERIFKREALLGVSMTGVMDAPDICLDEEVQKYGAELVKKTNKFIAKIIGINQAARTTCLKPEGTSSCILGTASGIHPHHSKRYIRRVQANTTEDVYQFFKSVNPLACERSVWSNNDTDDVISFTIEVPDGAKVKNQLSAIELLSAVKNTQINWVTNGRNEELCVKKFLNHNVSNTITILPDEWDSVTRFIYDNRQFFCGVSLLPISGDKDYPQAPFTSIYLPSEMYTEYGDAYIFASGLIVEAKQLFEDNLWKACDALLGVGEKVRGTSKLDWIDRCTKYAEKYCGGDNKRLTYCMKDVDNYKRYIDLKREYKKVDYELLVEEDNNVVVEQNSACAGGVCEI